MPPALRKVAGAAAAGLLAGALALALHALGLIEHLELRSIDWRQRHAPAGAGAPAPDGARPPVAIVYQGEASLEAASRPENAWPWPWPRSVWRPLLDLARRDGARALVFDIVFSERSALQGDDEELEAGMRDLGGVFLATAFHRTSPRAWPPGMIERVRECAVTVTAEDPAHLDLFAEMAAIHSLSIEPLLRAARGLGNVREPPDPDGVYRRVAPFVRFEGRLYPTLALAVANEVAGGGAPFRLTRDRVLVFGSGAGERRIPLERDGTMLIRFGPELVRAHVRAVEAFDAILAGAEPEPAAKGTYEPGALGAEAVFAGYHAIGTFDLKPNPLMRAASGMLVHVAATQNLLSGRALRSWTRRGPAPLLAAALLLGALTSALVASTARVERQLLLAAAVGAAWLGAAVLVAFPAGLVVDLAAPLAAVVLGLIAGALHNYVTEGRQRRRVKEAFQHYLSPAFVEELLKDPEKLRLGGERRELTVFFSDLAGFTTLSERLSPEELVRTLNVYLTHMTQVVLRHGGTHDKYIGDAVMAFWGAPVPIEEHAALACLAALDQQREIERLNAEWAAVGLPTVLARMGINTGEVVVGNMGSEQTMEYTVMGDAVNLASRLEGANKPFGTLIMCGERTAELARGRIEFREMAGLKVKGKQKPVKVFEVLGEKGAVPPERLAAARRFEEGLRLFEARRFGDAAEVFEELVNGRGDEPSKLYLAECRSMAEAPPAPEWDGVVTLTTK